MAAKIKCASRGYRATNNFETALANIWDELRGIPEMETIAPDRLKQEMFFIWQVGGNYLRQPTRPDRVRRCLITAEEAQVALQTFFENLRKYVYIYDAQLFSTAYLAHPVYGQTEGQPLDLMTLGTEITKVLAGMDVAMRVFATFPGLSLSKKGEIVVSRKATSTPLVNVAHVAMKSWQLLTGKEFQFPKGVILTKNEGMKVTIQLGKKPRPVQDDANFVFLCLKLTAKLDDPRSAVTAVRKAREAKLKYQKALALGDPRSVRSAARADYLERNDDLARRMIYGLTY